MDLFQMSCCKELLYGFTRLLADCKLFEDFDCKFSTGTKDFLNLIRLSLHTHLGYHSGYL